MAKAKEVRENITVDTSWEADSSEQIQPLDMGEGVNIGFVGFPRSGKTMTMLTLDRAMMESRWQIRPANQLTLDYIEPLKQNLGIGLMPPANQARNHLTYKVSRVGGRLGFVKGTWPPIKLEVLDAPGSDTTRSVDSFTDVTLRYISRCSGVLFLIDPEELWQTADEIRSFYASMPGTMNEVDAESRSTYYKSAYFDNFDAIFNRIAMFRDEGFINSGTVGVYFAFCLTKMDQFTEQQVLVKEFAEQVIGTLAMRRIDQYCRNNVYVSARWFATSAVGLRRVEETGASISRIDPQSGRIIAPANIEPFGIKEAVEWLLDSVHDDINRADLFARFRQRFRKLGGRF